MNSCTLAITIVKAPEVRYTQDNLPLGQCLGQFYLPYAKDNAEPISSLIRVIGFGEYLANEIVQLEPGVQYIVLGRLETRTAINSEGYKEKKVELIAEKIQALSPISTELAEL